jgi:pyruvate,water dikinase
VQARPITTIDPSAAKAGGLSHAGATPLPKDLKGKEAAHLQPPVIVSDQPAAIVTGSPASPGIGVGPVKVLKSPKEIDKIHKGDVLVASQTNPDYVPAMKKAAAIVTERGGRTSHAAIVSRELGVPAVVGAEGALKLLKDEMVVSVDGGKGEVYKGSITHKTNGVDAKAEKAAHMAAKHPHKTLTKVYANLAEPEQAEKVSKLNVDGIGLLRAEFMIAGIGTHPKEFIRQKRQHEFVRKLTHELTKFAKPFYPRPIIYRATDFKTNEYRHLKGGAQYEPQEENPMIGFRGASRYIANPDVFDLELQALAYLWKMGFNNIHLMIPFVRRPWELIKIKSMVEQSGLLALPGFRLLIMVEVPAAALELEDFLKIGVDGVSIGTNDLTMMLLGLDRDNEEVAHMYSGAGKDR